MTRYKLNVFTGKQDRVGGNSNNSGLPVGTILAFPTTSIPSNFVWADGSLYSTALYPDLFALIGYTYGGSGANFRVPNIKDRFLKGDNGTNIGTNGGSNALTTPQLPIVNASGTVQVSQNDGSIPVQSNAFFSNISDINANQYLGFVANGNQNPTVLVQGVNVNFGGGQPHEHPHIVVRYAICYASIGAGVASPTPSLQQVTNVGNTTTNSIIVDEGLGNGIITINPVTNNILVDDLLGNVSEITPTGFFVTDGTNNTGLSATQISVAATATEYTRKIAEGVESFDESYGSAIDSFFKFVSDTDSSGSATRESQLKFSIADSTGQVQNIILKVNRFVSGGTYVLQLPSNPNAILATTEQLPFYVSDVTNIDNYESNNLDISAYLTGQVILLRASNSNTGAATLNLNSFGAKNIVKNFNQPLVAGDIIADEIAYLAFDGVNFQLLNPKRPTQMPANTIKANNTTTTSDPLDLAINPDSFVGRIDELNSGNLTSIPVQKFVVGQILLNNGSATVFNINITPSSMAFYTATSVGTLSSVPLRADVSVSGQCTFSNGQVGDNALINYQIYF